MTTQKEIMANDDKIINWEEARLKLAHKGPPGGLNWLGNLPFGTRFLASRKSEAGSDLYDFVIATDPKQLAAVLLGLDLGNSGFRWKDPVKFSRDYDLFLTLETKQEEENGNSIAVETRGVEGDGEHQVVHVDDEK